MSKVTEVLQLIAGTTKATVFSYGDDFSVIWKIVSVSSQRQNLKDLVIVWDGIPSGNTGKVATAPYLTPIDFAVALSLSIHDAVEDRKAAEKTLQPDEPPVPPVPAEYPELRILILDLDSRHISSSPAVRFVKEFPWRSLMSMPWVRLFRPAVAHESEWDAVNLIENLRTDPARDRVPTMKEALATSKPDLDAIRRVWASFLAKPSEADDHHALANLIGPAILIGDATHRDDNVKALRAEMTALGLVAPADDKNLPTVERPWVDLDELEGPERVKFLLIDDQWRQGWGEFVCKALGVPFDEEPGIPCASIGKKEGVIVKSSESATWIVDKIQKLDDEKALNQRFRLVIDDDPNFAEILLLDLRLFSGRPITVEADFIARVFQIAKKYHQRNPADDLDFAWPGFSDEEIARVESWLVEANKKGATNDLRNDSRYHEALTLLPRVLSFVDPTLPIVIFSSTSKRRVAENVKNHANIYSRFAKLTFDGQPIKQSLELVKKTFTDAINLSVRLAASRRRTYQVLAKSKTEERENPLWSHAAFYIDESGGYEQELVTVGGILALFRDDNAEKQFNDTLVQNGIHWSPRGIPKRPDDEIINDIGSRILDLAAQNGVELMGVAITARSQYQTPTNLGPNNRFGSSQLDLLHRTLLKALCNFSLLIIPGPRHNFTCAVLVDNRVQPNPADAAQQQALERFGLFAEPLRREERIVDANARLKKVISALHGTDIAKLGLPPRSGIALQHFLDSVVDSVLAPKTQQQVRESRKIPTIGRSSVYPLIEDLFQERRYNPRVERIRVVEAQACALPEGSPGATNYPNRSLHYFADWFTNQVFKAWGGLPKADWAKALAKKGFVLHFEQPNLALAEIAQFFEEGKAVEAITMSALAGDWLAAGPDNVYKSSCLRSIGIHLNDVPGDSLVAGLLQAGRRESGRIVTWGNDKNGKPFGLIESKTFEGTNHIQPDVLRTPDWQPRRGEAVKFLRKVAGNRLKICDVWKA